MYYVHTFINTPFLVFKNISCIYVFVKDYLLLHNQLMFFFQLLALIPTDNVIFIPNQRYFSLQQRSLQQPKPNKMKSSEDHAQLKYIQHNFFSSHSWSFKKRVTRIIRARVTSISFVRLGHLEMSEAILKKFHEHDCLNLSWTKMTPTDVLTDIDWECSRGLNSTHNTATNYGILRLRIIIFPREYLSI